MSEQGMHVRAWQPLAAPGTDPELLARTVTCLAVDPAGLRTRLAEAGIDDAQARLRASVASVPADLGGNVDAVLRSWRRLDVRAALVGDPAYPAQLVQRLGTAAPSLLAWRGSAPGLWSAAVAIVGSRRASGYGRGVAAWLAEVLADAGVHVVSGGAVGIDAAAHDAAAARATTVVLGCGHAVAYPRPHARPDGLFGRVLAGGGTLLSESLPDAEPRPYRVRDRNRIVAALVDAVVVVEGGTRSGALLTAGIAADIGVPVLAVPGDVRASGSVAPHRLLSEGATVCTSPSDVLEVIGHATADAGGGEAVVPSEIPGLPPAAARLLAEHWPRGVDVDELAQAAGMPTGSLLAAITRARISGLVSMGHEGVRLERPTR